MMNLNEQLEMLLSRNADGDLTAGERERMNRAMADDPNITAIIQQYDRLARLLTPWHNLPSCLNWAAFHTRVSNQIEQESTSLFADQHDPANDPQSEVVHQGVRHEQVEPPSNAATHPNPTVNDLLQDWADPLPKIDWQAYRARVSAAIDRAASGRTPHATTPHHTLRKVATWLTPLAAAAAITLAILMSDGSSSNRPTIAGSRGPIVRVSIAMPSIGGRVAIDLDESPFDPAGFGDQAAGTDDLPGGAAIAVGSMQENRPSRGENSVVLLY